MSPLSLASLVAVLLAAPAPTLGEPQTETYTIRGVVRHPQGAPVANALVLVQCTCLPAVRETQTDDFGRYRFTDLPAGDYTVQVLAGMADVSKFVQLPR